MPFFKQVAPFTAYFTDINVLLGSSAVEWILVTTTLIIMHVMTTNYKCSLKWLSWWLLDPLIYHMIAFSCFQKAWYTIKTIKGLLFHFPT